MTFLIDSRKSFHFKCSISGNTKCMMFHNSVDPFSTRKPGIKVPLETIMICFRKIEYFHIGEIFSGPIKQRFHVQKCIGWIGF